MKLTRTKRNHGVTFNITPMIDIVFLLIIFFMTVSQITRVVDHPVNLPSVSAAASSEAPASVTMNIRADGEIIISGNRYSLTRTIQILQKKIQQLGGDTSKINLELRCDRSCASDHVNRIIEELSSVGIKFVKIAVSES